MPGGGLYKRVAQATKTAQSGPDHLLQTIGSTKPDAPEVQEEDVGQEEVCDVQAFTVWYWTDGPEASFVPETMYMNSKDIGHQTGEPRLIVSLSSFEALSQAYVMSVEKEGIKAALLQEKEDLLQEVRVGYYKELQHLRELLSMAKEQMALARGGRLQEADKKRMEDFERQVRETDVHYFNIVEYLEPDLKHIMKDAVKQFNKDLMLENYNLKDRLALHEGSDGEEGLAERMITLLMSKGTTPAQIVKILAGMVNDKQQSDDFADSCRGILGISKTPLEREESRKFKRPEKTEEEKVVVSLRRTSVSSQADDHSPDSNGALMKEHQAEADRLRAELERLQQQVLQDRAMFEKEKAELKAQMEEEQRKASEAVKALQACEAKLEKAIKASGTVTKDGKVIKVRDEDEYTPGGTHKKRRDSDDVSEYTPGGTKIQKEVAGSHGGPSMKDLEAARRKAREAEDQLKALEARLREANNKISKLSEDLAEAQAEAERHKAKAQAGGRERRDSKESVGEFTPGGTRVPKSERKAASEKTPKEEEDHAQRAVTPATPTKPKRYNSGLDTFVPRDTSKIDRSGDYSAVSGKPVALVEEELIRERKMRIGLEGKTRDMTVTINDLSDGKFKLEVQIHSQTKDLEEVRQKLQRLIDDDQADGVEDIQIFCKWLVKRYGSLQNGFNALDTSRNGGLSVSEFNSGLLTMGWIKIVGRRLFTIIDQQEKGEIDMSDLQAIWDKFVDGQEDEDDMAALLKKAEEDMKADEKSILGEVRERNRKLIIQNQEFEDEIKRLQRLCNISNSRAKGLKDGDEEGMKNLERKNDLIKDSYEKLKGERDEMTSKMTAAMWKCREAHILQVKYQRQAETSQQDLTKLQKKYDAVRAAYKKKHAEDPDAIGEFGFSALAGNMASLAQMSTAIFTSPSMLKSFTLETGDGSSTGATLPEQLAAGSASRTATAPGTTILDGAMRCPSCNTVLRLQPRPGAASTFESTLQATASASPGVLRNLLKDCMAGAGDNGAGLMPSDGEDDFRLASAENRRRSQEMSPEELLANMTDEDLLFGSPSALKAKSNANVGRPLPAGGSGAAYKLRADGHANEHGKKHRWQLLFADAQDRRVGDSMRPGSPQALPVPEEAAMPNPTSSVILSKDSVNLLEHARQVRGMWKEAVPIDNAFSNIGNTDDELRAQVALARIGGSSRSFGVGGGCTSQSMAGSLGGRIRLGPSRPEPSVLNMSNIGSLASSNSLLASVSVKPMDKRSSPPPTSFLDANNLLPSANDSMEGFFPATASNLAEGQRSPVKEKHQKKLQKDNSPRNMGPPLQIVGNDSGWARIGTPPTSPPAQAVGRVSSPEKRIPPKTTATPPLTVKTWEAGALPSHVDFEFDEGIYGQSMGGHGNSKVVGSWRRTLMKGGDVEPTSPVQALGAGLPTTPELLRTTSSLSRGGLRRVPAQGSTLPQLDAARSPSKPSNKLSVSMPDLGIIFDRAATSVRTPPLAEERAQPAAKGRNRSTRGLGQSMSGSGLPSRAGDSSSSTAPFEAPLLYVGNPPAESFGMQGKLSDSLRNSRLTGASHTVPADPRNQFMMAASALDLASHVQRHADHSEAPIDAPMIVTHASKGRTLLS